MKNKKQNLLAKIPANFAAKSVAAAVSGGADSVAMLLLLNDFCRIKKIRLCVFHVDHAIRSESENDRKWVAGLAERLGLSFFWRGLQEKVRAQSQENAARPGQEISVINVLLKCLKKQVLKQWLPGTLLMIRQKPLLCE